MTRLTIITSTLNCADGLQQTANSIREQASKDLQWIVVDGKSSDGTIDVAKKNSDIISHFISEKDAGIYDAWNKGAVLISGEWVLFLGAGDKFPSSTSIKKIQAELKSADPRDVVFYGDVQISGHEGVRYISRKTNLSGYEFARPKLPNHQGAWQRANLFKSPQPFDTSYLIAGDSKFMLKALRVGTFRHMDFVVAEMSDNGISNSYKYTFKTQREINRLCRELGIRQPFVTLVRAYAKRLMNYVLNSVLPTSTKSMLRRSIDKMRRP